MGNEVDFSTSGSVYEVTIIKLKRIEIICRFFAEY